MTDKPAQPHLSNDEILLPPQKIREIMDTLPHRYPFILVDRVTELVQGKRIKGYKNVTINEPFFQGHFPGDPIMPGVLQLEAMAQLGILLMKTIPATEGKLAVFAGMNDVRFRRMVIPGDQFEMECEILKLRLPIGKMSCKAYVAGELAVEAEIICSLVDREASAGR
ncbi:3-hydroxyacyl-ACP dehydratase FabZ [Vampirovibrio sp.]|uniref:3-hydroxyacyl-ACP dehydratase FabZ n=1 Tax=Vampirovibrio sp. TaxID=2717857 RepID=UPI003594673B